MGALARLFKRETAIGKQVDTSCDDERTLEEQLIDAEANLARVKELPISAFTPRINAGFIAEHSVDRKNNAIAYAKADIAGLKVKLEAK